MDYNLTLKLLREQLRNDLRTSVRKERPELKNKQQRKKKMSTQTATPQIQTLLDNYNEKKAKRDKMRTEYLAVRKDVREMHGMLKTLVQFGVVSPAVLGKDDEEDEEEKPNSEE